MLRRHRKLSFAGGIHFVTVVTGIRGNWFVEEDLCHAILESFEHHRRRMGIRCYGYVLMPDHLHALLEQNTHDEPIFDFIREVKKWTARRCRPGLYTDLKLWRTRYDDVPVPGRNAALAKLNYIHANPVRKGLVLSPEDYRWSSARFYWNRELGIVDITQP